MSSIKTNITHDHIYLANTDTEKDCNQAKNCSKKKDNRRIIRKKCDIQTEEDREEYFRRRTLNNTSCRISRLHRRSKFDFIIKKSTEYEDLNTKLKLQKSILIQVIDQLKEHLRTLILTKNIKQNE
jgi:hypothetical protein